MTPEEKQQRKQLVLNIIGLNYQAESIKHITYICASTPDHGVIFNVELHQPSTVCFSHTVNFDDFVAYLNYIYHTPAKIAHELYDDWLPEFIQEN